MSHITKAFDAIKLAAADLGGLNFLAEKAGVNVDTARRLVRKPTSAITDLEALAKAAAEVLGSRAP